MGDIKLLMFGWEFAPVVSGGLGVVCRSLSQHLAKHNVKINFVLPKIPKQFSVNYLNIINAAEEEVDESLIKYFELPTFLTPYLAEADFDKLSNLWKKKRVMDLDEVIHNAVDLPDNVSFEAVDDTQRPYKLVLFLARLAPSKGADYLLRAAAKVLKIM